MTNKSRLRLLHLREQNLQDLFQIAREQLTSLASSSQYVQFQQGIIVQGFLQLLEPQVSIHIREADAAAAKQAAEAASKQYTDISGRKVQYEIVTSLSPDLYVEPTLCGLCPHAPSVVPVG
jgi:V-type H+-transporting ATPase subunit E